MRSVISAPPTFTPKTLISMETRTLRSALEDSKRQAELTSDSLSSLLRLHSSINRKQLVRTSNKAENSCRSVRLFYSLFSMQKHAVRKPFVFLEAMHSEQSVSHSVDCGARNKPPEKAEERQLLQAIAS